MLWTADIDPYVLHVDAVAAATATADCFDIRRFAALVTVVRNKYGGEHIAISNGYNRIRLDVITGSLLDGPALLRYHLEGFGRLDQTLLSLRRLAALNRRGHFVTSLFPVSSQTKRHVVALRIYDALATGASQRDMAVALFGWDTVESDWAAASDYLRLRVRRLVGLARQIAEGEWLQLLR